MHKTTKGHKMLTNYFDKIENFFDELGKKLF